MSLITKLLKSGSAPAYLLSESPYITEREVITTGIPLLNIALGGDPLKGGLMPGLSIFAGERATFKTRIALELVKTFLNAKKDSACLYYDSEFGASLEYFREAGIDMDRVLHIGIEHIEQLKFDIAKRLEETTRDENLIIFIDSIGMIASKKEIEDAVNEKAVADMTRAKALRSLFRIVTPHLVMKNIPCITIAHTYQTMEMFSKAIVGGGTAPMYAANEVFIISKKKEKDADKKIEAYQFTLKVEKSRTVREESKFPLIVSLEEGIARNSGLIEIAEEAGIVTKPKNGYYMAPGLAKPVKYDVLMDDNETWDKIIASDEFREHVKKTYCLVK